jgi:hypothetical protein
VCTFLPFTARCLKPSERAQLNCRLITNIIVIDGSLPPPVEDETLNLWLNMLNAKLDCLIRHAVPKQDDVVVMSFEPLNISGSGMGLMTRESVHIGDLLEIRLVIQAYPAKALCLYGEVVRIEDIPSKPEHKNVSVKFRGMTDDVRDEILQFDFQKQRKKILASPK